MFNSSFYERLESIQYNVVFAIVGAIRGISEKKTQKFQGKIMFSFSK